TDPEGKRLCRLLEMPDLSRSLSSPLYELAKRIVNLKDFEMFDIIEAPEIVDISISFDLFDFPLDHPARSRSDTYYVNDKNILRPHTTIMWYYHLKNETVKKRIENREAVGALAYGKVYRKDEIDRNHMNVFHQMDGWYLIPREQKIITSTDLEDVLVKIAHAIFGSDIKYRFNKDTFPYTDPSIEMEIEKNGKWIEVVGAGVVSGKVLEKLGVDSKQYNGWAFGFGLERLAILSMELPDIRLLWSSDERVKKQLKLGQKFKEVSKYPLMTRDISFVVENTFVPNNYFDLIRDLGGNLVEETKLLDKYEDLEKFGKDKISYTYRIIYRSPIRTLTNEEINKIQNDIYNQTAKQFGAVLR
ncbi:MAG: Phenylalanyl-tRNA synthetase, partial [Parcubacteria group bacterium GW2011_GWA2_42_18]